MYVLKALEQFNNVKHKTCPGMHDIQHLSISGLNAQKYWGWILRIVGTSHVCY